MQVRATKKLSPTEAWIGKGSNAHQFQPLHFQPRDIMWLAQRQGTPERDTMTLNHKVQWSSTFYPLNFPFFNAKCPIKHTIWLSHVSQECHSELFHVGSTWPVRATFKYEIAFCSHFINMTKHRKIKIQKLTVSIQIYWDKQPSIRPKEANLDFWLKTLGLFLPEDYVLNRQRQFLKGEV